MAKTKNDEKIKLLIAKVKEQKEALGKKPRAAWRTNGIFKFADGEHFNINTVTQPEILIRALGHLIMMENSSAEAAKRLSVVILSEGTWNGYKVSEYEEDFKLRIQMFKYDKKKKTLDKTKKKLDSLVSEEARTEMELDDIEALLA